MEPTSADIQALADAINAMTLVMTDFFAFDTNVFNLVLFSCIMSYISGHIVGRVMWLMRKT